MPFDSIKKHGMGVNIVLRSKRYREGNAVAGQNQEIALELYAPRLREASNDKGFNGFEKSEKRSKIPSLKPRAEGSSPSAPASEKRLKPAGLSRFSYAFWVGT